MEVAFFPFLRTPPRPPPLPRPHQLKRSCFLRRETCQVSIVDIGCGFGGLTVALSELFPDKGVLGMEIRMKVNSGRSRGRVSLAITHPRRRALNSLVFHRRFCGACVTAHLGSIFRRPVIDLSFEAWSFALFFLSICPESPTRCALFMQHFRQRVPPPFPIQTFFPPFFFFGFSAAAHTFNAFQKKAKKRRLILSDLILWTPQGVWIRATPGRGSSEGAPGAVPERIGAEDQFDAGALVGGKQHSC